MWKKWKRGERYSRRGIQKQDMICELEGIRSYSFFTFPLVVVKAQFHRPPCTYIKKKKKSNKNTKSTLDYATDAYWVHFPFTPVCFWHWSKCSSLAFRFAFGFSSFSFEVAPLPWFANYDLFPSLSNVRLRLDSRSLLSNDALHPRRRPPSDDVHRDRVRW